MKKLLLFLLSMFAASGFAQDKASAPDYANLLQYSKPSTRWVIDSLPIGNGTIGACLLGKVDNARLQFTVDSMWIGDENPTGDYAIEEFGASQSFGNIFFQPLQPNRATITSTGGIKEGTKKADKAADGNVDTKWCPVVDGEKALTWTAAYREPVAIKFYSFTSAEDVPTRDPYTWKLEGSNDGKTWQQLDAQSDVAPMARRKTKQVYQLGKTAKFSHYRFTFQPRPNETHFQLAEITLGDIAPPKPVGRTENYKRSLNLKESIHVETWTSSGVDFKREAIASYPDNCVVWRFTASEAGQISGAFTLTGTHEESDQVAVENEMLNLSGQLPNKLKYDAKVKVLHQGGSIEYTADSIEVKGCDEVTVYLVADTNYVLDLEKGFMDGTAKERTQAVMNAAVKKDWDTINKAHLADYQALYNRVELDLGSSDPEIASMDTNLRIQNYRDKAQDLPLPSLDPELEAMLFNYGRYLLISCSREGTLPAHLQGIWVETNNPGWRGDFHTNINLQMNYWLSELTNLPELSRPLFALLNEQIPVYKKYTREEYGETEGFVTRMSLNPFAGGGWNWNIEGTAWLAQHYMEHYNFSGDKEFLETQAYPWLRQVTQFWLPRLKVHENGKLVVPDAWSHEHGPYSDGTAHAQQLMWDLFTNTAKAAKVLGVDEELQQKLGETIPQLQGPKIGSWGQLMEWMDEMPKFEKSAHRHTSHLYAVFPGNQISPAKTPEFAKGAAVSLAQRGESDLSRQSWTWPWRTAIWARLNNPERAHGCVSGMLAHNILDNLWARCSSFQVDGSYGITTGIAECLLQSQDEDIHLLPSLPKPWYTGSVKGLRARGNVIVDMEWKDGELVSATLHTKDAFREITQVLVKGKPVSVKDSNVITINAG